MEKVKIAIMVPYPHPGLGATDQVRVARVDAYLREVVRRLQRVSLGSSTVSAFYWGNETVTDADTALVSRIASIVHSVGMRFLWIPYWEARNATRWRSLGFDEAWQQPNYFFHPDVPTARIDSAVSRAEAAGMGLEIEFDGRLFSNPTFSDRLHPYLNALEKTPELRHRSIAIYEGAGALIHLSRSRDAQHRALYDRLVAVLRSDSQP